MVVEIVPEKKEEEIEKSNDDFNKKRLNDEKYKSNSIASFGFQR